jgi:hypothetical protein
MESENIENSSLTTINDILVNGLITDVLNAERYNMVFNIIRDNATKLTKSEVDIKTFFSIVQEMAQNACILSLARVYDKPSKRYETRSLLYLIEKLRELAGNLPRVEEDALTLKILKQYNLPRSCCDALKDVDASRFPIEIATYYEDQCKNSGSLKEFRDKLIAHNEVFNGKPSLTWQAYVDLTNLAKQVIEIIGMAYFSSMYQGAITSGAERNAISTDAILRRLGIIDDIA